MGIGNKKGRYYVFLFGLHAAYAFAAPFLAAEFRLRRAFYIAARGDSDDHVFAFDQIFVFHVA